MPRLTIEQAFQIAIQHHRAGQLSQAEDLYRRILAKQPNNANVLHHLGLVAHQTGWHAIAIDLIRQAIALQADFPEAQCNLGVVLKENGQLDEAIAAYRRAIALRPRYPEAYNNLGNVLREKGSLDEAIAAYQRALAIAPHYAEAHSNLGNVFYETGQLDQAAASYRQALALNPQYAEAQNNLSNVLKDTGQLDEAIVAVRQVIALKPQYAEAYNNLGGDLKDRGQLSEAISAYRHAIALKPGYTIAHSNLVYALLFHSNDHAETIPKEHRLWNRQRAEPLKELIKPHVNDRDPDRRLRIGYVSADFRDHPVGRCLLPLLAHHDKNQFEVFAYAQSNSSDEMTRCLRLCTNSWRSIVGRTDEGVADLIRQDRIDILIDLSLHMAGNRLLVFARKPAPVQVTNMGYPGTTGLDAIDYRISDPYLDPPGMDDSVYSEQTVRLPDTFWCYEPQETDIPIGPLPADKVGYVTFASLNNFCKVCEQVISLWAKVLNRVPGSRLLLLAPPGSARQSVHTLFESLGVSATRVEFVAHQSRRLYLETYHQTDIGLDTFPYNGHATSLDSLWMGVPVVTRVGRTIVGRAGLSQLSNLNMTELAAHNDEQFVSIAADLANDRGRLAALRSTLRPRMQASALMDAPKYARSIESAYRQMWRTWCATGNHSAIK